jgi:PrtD family type I secretion system ABC transporter
VKPHTRPANQSTVVADALGSSRAGLRGAFVFSLVMNVLLLTGPFYMLQIYDRVLTSQSLPTLTALSILVVALLLLYGFFEFLRSRLMARVAAMVDLRLAGTAFQEALRLAGGGAASAASAEALRDLRVVRQFLASPAAAGLFDVPWMPVYLAVIFLLHPALGWVAVGGSLALIVIALANERYGRLPSQQLILSATREDGFVASARLNAETVKAMGMLGDLARLWGAHHGQTAEAQRNAGDPIAGFAALSRSLRLILQSTILGVGAYLAIANELSPGVLIAASIVFGRALAPVDMVVAQWRTIAGARQSWNRLKATLTRANKDIVVATVLPAPRQNLVVDQLYVGPPDERGIIVQNVSFNLEAGEALGVIGASGSGKSSLARALVGAWPAVRGEVRLDGATLSQWDDAVLGHHIGYLPQDVHLFDGTVAENISRFRAGASSEDIVAAAKLAGTHDIIVQLPDGYDTRIGAQGATLSAGQRQRLGLARAIFGGPFLIVLDEPNAHLDAEGELALVAAIDALRAAGKIIVVVAHRKTAITKVDKLVWMEDGKVSAFGPKDQVLADIRQKASSNGGLRVVSR